MQKDNGYCHFFLADDDDDDRLIFTEALREVSPFSSCQTVANGKEAVEKLERTEALPDIIFLDINMPLLNGFECLAELKKRKKFAHIPVVILSTASNNSVFETAHALGADAFLIKPNSHRELVDKLKYVLEMDITPSRPFDTDYSSFPVK